MSENSNPFIQSSFKSTWHKKYLFFIALIYSLLGFLDDIYISVESDIDLIQRISISLIGFCILSLSKHNKDFDRFFKTIFQIYMGLVTAHMIYLIASCHYAISHVIELIVVIIVGSISFDKIRHLYIYHGINALLIIVLTNWITNPEIDIATYLAIFIAIIVTVFIATYLNLQNQIKIREELVANQTLLKSIFIDASDAIFLCESSQNTIVDCNKEALKLIRNEYKASIDKLRWVELFKNENEDFITELNNQSSLQKVVKLTSKSDRWGDISVKELFINFKKYYLVRIIDITERLESESKQKQLEKEKEIAEIAAENKAMFLSNMSHEIRTPINAIINLTSMLLDDDLPLRAKEYIKLVQYSSDNLLAIVNDILDFSKIDSKSFKLEKTDFNFIELINQLIKSNEIKAQEKNLDLLVQIDPNIPSILVGDPYRLNQILLNLISNAIKFTHKGFIKLSVKCNVITPNKVEIGFAITDTGIGIDKDKFKQIFDSFMQANTSTTRVYGGTGLGLSITQKLLQIQNSEIHLESEINKGSTFSFKLEFELSNFSEEQIENYKIEKEKLTNNISKSIKLLLVEDNEMNQYVAKQLFERQGIRYDIASDGEEAFSFLKNIDYDIILLDIQLPNISGYEIASTLRNQNSNLKNSNKPIIALTANAFEEVKSKAFASGMNDFVTKPFKPKDLIDAISRNLAKFENNKSEVEEHINAVESTSEEVYDKFALLRQLTFNNEASMQAMIGVFLRDTPKELEKIMSYFEIGNFEPIGRIIHAIKPKFTYMGSPDISTLCKEIELLIVNKSKIDDIEKHILDFERKCTDLLEELKKEFIS